MVEAIRGGLDMSPSGFARFAAVILVLFLLTISTVSVTTLLSKNSAKELAVSAETGLTAHEWGTFTSVTGTDGESLYWRPLLVESDLPSFVYSIDKGASWRGLRYPSKSGMSVRVRMETPVIYFYTNEPNQVTVRVDLRGGKITEWYPHALHVATGGMEWKFEVFPGLHTNLPHDARENHYYPARETDAAVLQVRNDSRKLEHEKFLFYRGVGNFSLPVAVRVVGSKLEVKNAVGADVKKAIVFENRNGQIGYQVCDLVDGQLTIERPSLDGKLEGLLKELKNLLVSEGLFEKEAEAMLRTWRNSWFEPGLRVFYIVPRKFTDEILPLKINPEPQQLERVLMGRAEIITPEMEKDLSTHIGRLGNQSAQVRENARSEIFKYGRFLEPLLAQVSSHSTDPQVIKGIESLYNEMPR
jgi:hypothetical protein